MNYQEVINYIHSTPKFARTLGNDLLSKLLDKLDNPQDKLKYVHLAGTNGKGSCAFMLSEVLTRCGYKVGLFTSPYIERYNERIRINGEPISDRDLTEIGNKVKAVIESCDTPVSEFALNTAIAFLHFEMNACDIVILETGLGGRLDATNVIKTSEVSVITSIGLDHTEYLGETIREITAEKCGIIKNKGNVVCYSDLPGVCLATLEYFCNVNEATLTVANRPVILPDNKLMYKGTVYDLKMQGDFQKYNATLVLSTLEKLSDHGWNITPEATQEGLSNAFNPGRFELLPCGIYIDGAHNPSALDALCDTLTEKGMPIRICIAMMEDKDIAEAVSVLSRVNPRVIVTEISMPRCLPAEKLAEEFKKQGISPTIIKDSTEAVSKLIEEAENTSSVVCGSLYLVGQVRNQFK